MRHYRPIATYSTMEDITNLFPESLFKRQEQTEQIVNAYLMGYGEPHIIPGTDEESIWDEKEIADDNANFCLLPDKRYGVRYTQGVMQDGLPYGYFIDIYEVIDEPEAETEFTEAQLKLIARKRRQEDEDIKRAIVREFKEHFTEPETGIDFYTNCPDDVVGYGEDAGTISKLVLGEDGCIYAWLIQEYEDSCEEFEDRYFGCDDWPQLLLNLRRGIRDGWEIEE